MFTHLLSEQDTYASKENRFELQCIDGLLLGVYDYTPMDGLSYIPLPKDITKKKAIINPQNTDQQSFKWAILAKHVTIYRGIEKEPDVSKHFLETVLKLSQKIKNMLKTNMKIIFNRR